MMIWHRVTHVPSPCLLADVQFSCVGADESRLSRSVTYELGAEAQKANIVASQAVRDTDDIVAASRRHDRDFLHDISNKMVRCLSTAAES